MDGSEALISMFSSFAESNFRTQHSREGSIDTSSKNLAVDSKELADRLAPLASSTPDRKGSAPNLSRASSADSPYRRKVVNGKP